MDAERDQRSDQVLEMGSLPDYASPPVVEVVVGLQFAPLTGLTLPHVGLYWARIRDEFVRAEEQAPIAHLVELPTPRRDEGSAFRVQTKPELPRTWFVSEDGNRILQVQRDRFLHNWRKMREEDQYPRFPEVRDAFFRHWEMFCDFLKESGAPAPQVDQCELTYVNLIPSGRAWQSTADLAKLFNCFAWHPRTGFLPQPESVRWAMQFALPKETGRLYTEALPVLAGAGNVPAIRFTLTARGMPKGEATPDALKQWLELARVWIVRGFADLVTEYSDTLWERRI